MPQVVFLAMLLNDAMKLGVLHGYMIGITEERNDSFRERISTLFYTMVFSDFLSIKQAADYAKETFKGAVRTPRSLPMSHYELCPHFNIAVAEEAARDFRIPEMIQGIFYAMVVNEALKLGVLSRDLAEHLKLCLEGLQWYMCKAWLQLDKLGLLCAKYHICANPGVEVWPSNG
ncbi:hypothetical protein Cgig2_023914 [Carnegiea gigantea]|uniref:Uncharacterized protein n=1 Tax=Carnegiea gigantea TaxID=171969 RepID=A0A9Q1JNK6_9CARY|nr:hypothetical protein Cgig2_023914 [Carnegiea gigantea]